MNSTITLTVALEPDHMNDIAEKLLRMAAALAPVEVEVEPTPEPTPEQERNLADCSTVFNKAHPWSPPTPAAEQTPPPPPPPPAAEQTPPPPPPPPGEDEDPAPGKKDQHGVKWDPIIHSNPAKLTKAGNWRKRRGAGEAEPADAPLAFEDVRKKMAALILACDMDDAIVADATKAMSQVAAGDPNVHEGGMPALKATGDAAKFKKALVAIDAVAHMHGVTL